MGQTSAVSCSCWSKSNGSVLPRALRRPGAGRLTYVLPTERDALPTERDTSKSECYVVRTARAAQFSRSREKAWLVTRYIYAPAALRQSIIAR